MAEESAPRVLAQRLQDEAIQMVAGNLLRYDAARSRLAEGDLDEVARLLVEAVSTQREVLDELRCVRALLAGEDTVRLSP